MDVSLAECDDKISLCFLVARNSFVCPPGADGPRPMAIFELLDYIVNEVCYLSFFFLFSFLLFLFQLLLLSHGYNYFLLRFCHFIFAMFPGFQSFFVLFFYSLVFQNLPCFVLEVCLVLLLSSLCSTADQNFIWQCQVYEHVKTREQYGWHRKCGKGVLCVGTNLFFSCFNPRCWDRTPAHTRCLFQCSLPQPC